jgi:spore coat protein U-like protein
MRSFFVLVLALAAMPAAVRAQVYTTTSAMPVRIELVGVCTLSASDLNFGAYVSNSPAPVLGQTTIQLQCSADNVADIHLDAGTGPGASTTNRRMEGSGAVGRINYGLYQDPGRTVHWGDRSGRDTLEVVTTGELQSIPIYGQIPAGQREQDGEYFDTITIRVLY